MRFKVFLGFFVIDFFSDVFGVVMIMFDCRVVYFLSIWLVRFYMGMGKIN